MTPAAPRKRASSRNPFALDAVYDNAIAATTATARAEKAAAAKAGKPKEWRIDEDVLRERVLKRCSELELWSMGIPKVRNPHGGWYTPYDKLSKGKGYFDLTIVGLWLMVRELKVEKTQRVEPEQKVWLAKAQAAGVDAGIWYLSDWNSGLIEAQLCACAGGVPIGKQRNGAPSMIYSPNAFGGGM